MYVGIIALLKKIYTWLVLVHYMQKNSINLCPSTNKLHHFHAYMKYDINV